jgi:hypothetical protein
MPAQYNNKNSAGSITTLKSLGRTDQGADDVDVGGDVAVEVGRGQGRADGKVLKHTFLRRD